MASDHHPPPPPPPPPLIRSITHPHHLPPRNRSRDTNVPTTNNQNSMGRNESHNSLFSFGAQSSHSVNTTGSPWVPPSPYSPVTRSRSSSRDSHVTNQSSSQHERQQQQHRRQGSFYRPRNSITSAVTSVCATVSQLEAFLSKSLSSQSLRKLAGEDDDEMEDELRHLREREDALARDLDGLYLAGGGGGGGGVGRGGDDSAKVGGRVKTPVSKRDESKMEQGSDLPKLSWLSSPTSPDSTDTGTPRTSLTVSEDGYENSVSSTSSLGIGSFGDDDDSDDQEEGGLQRHAELSRLLPPLSIETEEEEEPYLYDVAHSPLRSDHTHKKDTSKEQQWESEEEEVEDDSLVDGIMSPPVHRKTDDMFARDQTEEEKGQNLPPPPLWLRQEQHQSGVPPMDEIVAEPGWNRFVSSLGQGGIEDIDEMLRRGSLVDSDGDVGRRSLLGRGREKSARALHMVPSESAHNDDSERHSGRPADESERKKRVPARNAAVDEQQPNASTDRRRKSFADQSSMHDRNSFFGLTRQVSEKGFLELQESLSSAFSNPDELTMDTEENQAAEDKLQQRLQGVSLEGCSNLETEERTRTPASVMQPTREESNETSSIPPTTNRDNLRSPSSTSMRRSGFEMRVGNLRSKQQRPQSILKASLTRSDDRSPTETRGGTPRRRQKRCPDAERHSERKQRQKRKSHNRRRRRRSSSHRRESTGTINTLACLAFGRHEYLPPFSIYKTKQGGGEPPPKFLRTYEGGLSVFLATAVTAVSFHEWYPSRWQFWMATVAVPSGVTLCEVVLPHNLEETVIALSIMMSQFVVRKYLIPALGSEGASEEEHGTEVN